MELYVTEISKYVITLFLFLYTLEAFLAFTRKNEEKRKGLYIRQIICMFAMQISCFIQIIARTGKPVYLALVSPDDEKHFGVMNMKDDKVPFWRITTSVIIPEMAGHT